MCYVVEWRKGEGGREGKEVWEKRCGCGEDWFRLVWSDWEVPSIASFWGLVPSLLFPSGWCSTLSSPFLWWCFPASPVFRGAPHPWRGPADRNELFSEFKCWSSGRVRNIELLARKSNIQMFWVPSDQLRKRQKNGKMKRKKKRERNQTAFLDCNSSTRPPSAVNEIIRPSVTPLVLCALSAMFMSFVPRHKVSKEML